MKCQIPQIAWHEREPVLSIDFQPIKGNRFRLVSGGSDKLVLMWSVTFHSEKGINIAFHSEYDRHLKPVNVVRFNPSGTLLASGDDDGTLILWKLKENEDDEKWIPFKLISGRSKDIFDISWSADGNYLISASTENKAVMWDMQSFQVLHVFSDSKGFVQGVSWDPLNKYMASLGTDRALRIMSVKSKKTVNKIRNLPKPVGTDKNTPRFCLFHDDTLKSYFRRLTFTPDGELLIVPSGIFSKDEKTLNTTYIFSRHSLSEPVAHLPSGDKYTVAARCNPLLYKLRGSENKENCKSKMLIDLPYRMVFAVAACDSVLIYDTEQLVPLACISNIHYTPLTDLTWSADGRILVVSSTDGYCSFITFGEDELGEIYVPPPPEPPKADEPLKDVQQAHSKPENAVCKPEDALLKADVSTKTADSCVEPNISKPNDISSNVVSPKGIVNPSLVKPKKPKLTIESFFKSPKTSLQATGKEIKPMKEEVVNEIRNISLADKQLEFKEPSLISTPIRGKQANIEVNPTNKDVAFNDSDSVEVLYESDFKVPKCKVQLDFENKISKSLEEDLICDNAMDTIPESSVVSIKSDDDWKLELSQDDSIVPMDTTEPSTSKNESEKKPVETETTPKPKRRVNFITLSKTVSLTPPKL